MGRSLSSTLNTGLRDTKELLNKLKESTAEADNILHSLPSLSPSSSRSEHFNPYSDSLASPKCANYETPACSSSLSVSGDQRAPAGDEPYEDSPARSAGGSKNNYYSASTQDDSYSFDHLLLGSGRRESEPPIKTPTVYGDLMSLSGEWSCDRSGYADLEHRLQNEDEGKDEDESLPPSVYESVSAFPSLNFKLPELKDENTLAKSGYYSSLDSYISNPAVRTTTTSCVHLISTSPLLEVASMATNPLTTTQVSATLPPPVVPTTYVDTPAAVNEMTINQSLQNLGSFSRANSVQRLNLPKKALPPMSAKPTMANQIPLTPNMALITDEKESSSESPSPCYGEQDFPATNVVPPPPPPPPISLLSLCASEYTPFAALPPSLTVPASGSSYESIVALHRHTGQPESKENARIYESIPQLESPAVPEPEILSKRSPLAASYESFSRLSLHPDFIFTPTMVSSPEDFPSTLAQQAPIAPLPIPTVMTTSAYETSALTISQTPTTLQKDEPVKENTYMSEYADSFGAESVIASKENSYSSYTSPPTNMNWDPPSANATNTTTIKSSSEILPTLNLARCRSVRDDTGKVKDKSEKGSRTQEEEKNETPEEPSYNLEDLTTFVYVFTTPFP